MLNYSKLENRQTLIMEQIQEASVQTFNPLPDQPSLNEQFGLKILEFGTLDVQNGLLRVVFEVLNS